jgi:cholesterol oxidase
LLRGKKRIRDDPGFDAWRDTSSLFVRLFGPYPSRPDITDPCKYQKLAGYGVVHVDINTFLYEQLRSFAIYPDPKDPARTSWAITKFATFFFGELQRIYAPEILETLDTFLRLRPSNVRTGNAR